MNHTTHVTVRRVALDGAFAKSYVITKLSGAACIYAGNEATFRVGEVLTEKQVDQLCQEYEHVTILAP